MDRLFDDQAGWPPDAGNADALRVANEGISRSAAGDPPSSAAPRVVLVGLRLDPSRETNSDAWRANGPANGSAPGAHRRRAPRPHSGSSDRSEQMAGLVARSAEPRPSCGEGLPQPWWRRHWRRLRRIGIGIARGSAIGSVALAKPAPEASTASAAASVDPQPGR